MNELSIPTTTIAATVLSSSTGLRAYFPLFALGIAAAVGLVPLEKNFEILTNPILLAVLGALSILELVADKVPAVDHVSDAIHTVIRPVMGAIIFAGTDNAVSMQSPIVAGGLGLLLAGGVHSAKALTRPAVTASTVGIGNPIISTIEDVVVILLVVLAVLVPIVALVLLLLVALLFFLVVRAIFRRLRRRKQRQQNQPATVAGGPPVDNSRRSG
jgi:membrane protein implicated in regulation of membrane protease activity